MKNNSKKLISIVIPCFNEEKNVLYAYKTIKKIANKEKKYFFEYILVDNGSKDNTKNIITQIAAKDKNVKGIFLSRNFGPESSAKAGFDFTQGDAVVGIAADLQDPPETIIKFIREWEKGYKIIYGIYNKAPDNIVIRTFKKIFYRVYKIIANVEVTENVSGFGMFDRKVIDALNNLPEKYRFARSLVIWLGFKRSYVTYTKKDRLYGKSSYNFFDYIKHAERGIFGFSYLPLDLIVYTGFIITILSFLFIFAYLYWVFIFGNPINASIPLMLAIVFFGGINLLAISIIGKYIQVIVEETKNRPMYIVEDTINVKQSS